MILPFSTQINGKPTYFVEKILKSFDGKDCTEDDELMLKEAIYLGFLSPYKYDEVKPKLHTIREDKNDRWKPGVMIDFFINARQKNMFRFAPRIPVVSTQKINITWLTKYMVFVTIDNKPIGDAIWDRGFICMSCDTRLRELAKNDGFESVEDFFGYFNKDFTGKIIHWTDLRY